MDIEEKNNEEIKEKPKKHRKGLKKLLIFLIVLVMAVIILGIIFPGLIWTKNLGVTYTNADYKSILEKLNYIKDAVPAGNSADEYTYKYGEVKTVDVEFTSEEITAFFNENRPSYYALKNVQVKINDNGTIEASANVDVDYVLNDILGGDYSRDEIESEIPALGILPSHVNLYIKFSGVVTNNKSSAHISAVSVQGVSLPKNLIYSSEAKSVVNEGLNNLMSTYNSKTDSSFDNISVENGKIKFKAKVPSSLERIKN